jgi:hypothetical protein
MLLTPTACVTQRVTIETDVPSTVSYVAWSNPAAEGELIGKSPVTIEFSKLTGRAVRIDAPGKMPFLWTHSSSIAGESVTASIKLTDIPRQITPQSEAAMVDRADMNRVQRLIVRSYKALTSKDLELSQSLAEKAKDLAPFMAMPHVIIGMVELEKGDKDKARLAFSRGKALDPEDSDITTLLEMVEK